MKFHMNRRNLLRWGGLLAGGQAAGVLTLAPGAAPTSSTPDAHNYLDFLASDGEKPDRHRDQEFEDPGQTRAELLDEWEDGWRRVFEALDPLTDDDLQRTVLIRSEPHSVYKAVSRQVAHYAGHTYQILFVGKHLKGAAWKTLSVPRGQSEEFNRQMLARMKDGR